MDDTSPATKADITRVLHAIKESHDDLRRADDEILTVLLNVDKRLTAKTNDHERRIVRLERQAA